MYNIINMYIVVYKKLTQKAVKSILSVGSQNLVTLIFTKTTFCQGVNSKCMAHILTNSSRSRPIRTP